MIWGEFKDFLTTAMADINPWARSHREFAQTVTRKIYWDSESKRFKRLRGARGPTSWIACIVAQTLAQRPSAMWKWNITFFSTVKTRCR